MRRNRSIPSAVVIPVLVYPDVREAVAWLSGAFGFVERLQIGENHRSQLTFGDGAIIVADVRHNRRPPRAGESTHSVVVRVDDANAHCARARAYGAEILMEPSDFEYGERAVQRRPTRRDTGGRSPRPSMTSTLQPGADCSWNRGTAGTWINRVGHAPRRAAQVAPCEHTTS